MGLAQAQGFQRLQALGARVQGCNAVGQIAGQLQEGGEFLWAEGIRLAGVNIERANRLPIHHQRQGAS